MLRTPVAEHVLSALETVARTDEVRRNLDLQLFELDLLDSLGTVELIVLLSDGLGLELSPAEIDRQDWATPRKIVAYVEARVGVPPKSQKPSGAAAELRSTDGPGGAAEMAPTLSVATPPGP